MGLDEHPAALEEERPPREVPLPPADASPTGEVALLLHLDDLHPESLPLGEARVTRVGALMVHAPGASERVRAADQAALARAGAHFGCPVMTAEGDWAGSLPVVCAWAPIGPTAEVLPTDCVRIRRAWDEAAWPLATRGYTRVRSAIPKLMGGAA